MYFGMSRDKDEESLATFLKMFSEERLTTALIPRMSDEEINLIVDTLTQVMRTNLTNEEYHQLFLGNHSRKHRPGKPGMAVASPIVDGNI